MHVGVANHINGTEPRQLNSEIIAENAKRIAENPELVFDKLSINNPVFTKEEIAIALHEALRKIQLILFIKTFSKWYYLLNVLNSNVH